MILVDTSVWIDHFRRDNPQLTQLLSIGNVSTHPLIIGELACGNLKQRDQIISLLQVLPKAGSVDHDEILYFIEERQLMGLGVGIVDIHLLASATLSNHPLWTVDKRLLKNPLAKVSGKKKAVCSATSKRGEKLGMDRLRRSSVDIRAVCELMGHTNFKHDNEIYASQPRSSIGCD